METLSRTRCAIHRPHLFRITPAPPASSRQDTRRDIIHKPQTNLTQQTHQDQTRTCSGVHQQLIRDVYPHQEKATRRRGICSLSEFGSATTTATPKATSLTIYRMRHSVPPTVVSGSSSLPRPGPIYTCTRARVHGPDTSNMTSFSGALWMAANTGRTKLL